MIIVHQANRESVTDRHPRRSFTLIELLMVIVIIGILMSLAFAAYSGVMRAAKVAEVKLEIDGLSSALTDFKAKFGFFPPSHIRLWVTRAQWAGDPRSRAVIRRMFPQFNFSGNGGAPWNTPKVLFGGECLVFFLGGIEKDGTPNGFSNNPLLPFSTAGTNRIGPFFDFNAGRLDPGSSNGLFVYKSPLTSQTKPYLYFSAYDGKGYRCFDILGAKQIKAVYHQGLFEDNLICNGRLDAGEDTNNNNTLDRSQPWKPRSFQIICAGFDDEFGLGGGFETNAAEASLNTAAREFERDNITNFHPGMLAP